MLTQPRVVSAAEGRQSHGIVSGDTPWNRRAVIR